MGLFLPPVAELGVVVNGIESSVGLSVLPGAELGGVVVIVSGAEVAVGATDFEVVFGISSGTALIEGVDELATVGAVVSISGFWHPHSLV